MRAVEIFMKISGLVSGARRGALMQLALCLAMFAASPTALAAAGQVIFVTGQAFVQRDRQIPLTRGLDVEQGDTVVTYQDGRVQLLMANGDRIAIRPNSRFRIDEFEAPGRAEQTKDGVSLRQLGKSFYSLLRGGFRTLTGARGERNASNYRVRTPVATLGIRGTYYVVRYCNNDCYSGEGSAGKLRRRGEIKGLPTYAALWFSDLAPRDDSAPLLLAQGDDEFGQGGALLPNGLDVGVIHGSVQLKNDGGTTLVGAGQFTSIKSPGQKGQVTNTAPQSLQQDMQDADMEGNWEGLDDGEATEGEDDPYSGRRSPEDEGEDEDEDQGGFGGDEGANLSNEGDLTNEPEQPLLATDPNGNTVDLGSGSAGGAGGGTIITPGSAAFSSGQRSGVGAPSNLELGTSGNLRSFDVDGGASQFSYDGASEDRGRDLSGDTGLNWGRWSGGSATETTGDCPAGCTLDLTGESLHWIYSTNAPVLPQGGTYNYQLIGNTNPTDQHGNVGTLNSATFRADFLNQTVDSSVNLTVGGQTWDASGSGGFSQTQPGSFGGDYDSVSATGCSNGCSASGSFDGFFTGGDGSGAPPGAGMSYELGNTDGEQVNGAAAFGDPAPEVIGQ